MAREEGRFTKVSRRRRRSVGRDDAVVSDPPRADAAAVAVGAAVARGARPRHAPTIRRIAPGCTSCSASAARPPSCRSTCGGASAWRRRCRRCGARERRWCSKTSIATTRRRAASSASSSRSRARRRCWRRRRRPRCSTSRSRWCACRRSIRCDLTDLALPPGVAERSGGNPLAIVEELRARPPASPDDVVRAASCRDGAGAARGGGGGRRRRADAGAWRRRPASPTSGARWPS